jgi:hypothetical protein
MYVGRHGERFRQPNFAHNPCMPDVPEPIRRVAQSWIDGDRPAQPAIGWPRERWIQDFPASATLLEGLPERLDRADVAAIGIHAAESPERAVDAYLAVMAWGFGDTVGYGRFRTSRILNGREDAPARLHAVAMAVVNEGAIAGYRALATTSRLEFLGPSFGTKLLYFWQPPADRPRALIFDAFVAGWLDREAGVRIDAMQWSVAAYTRYLTQMHEWAAALSIEPDELEMCIFRSEASQRPGNQWGREAPTTTPRVAPAAGAVPFDAYPEGGRALLGKPKWGDGTARRSYGVKALKWCGYRCTYCGLPMSSFEGWLQLSIDHVVPQQMQSVGYPTEWVLDAINVVAACLACNGFFNRDPVIGDVPTTLEAFCDIRDRVFVERKAQILERRAAELAWLETNINPQEHP